MHLFYLYLCIVKTTTEQIYVKRLMKVLLHIQSNLDTKHQLDDLAKIALFSPYHFHRIFKAFTGESILKYIRRLKLERAANELKYSDKLIGQIAIKAGYENTESFSRVFRTQFDKSPVEYRKKSQKDLERSFSGMNKSYDFEPISIEIINNIPDKMLICLRHNGSYNDAGQTWNDLVKWVFKNKCKIKSSIGISYDNPKITEEDKIRYDACVELDSDINLEGKMFKRKLKGGKFAVMTIKGPYESLNSAYDYMYIKFLGTKNIYLRNEPSYEIYKNMSKKNSPKEYITEIYFPIF